MAAVCVLLAEGFEEIEAVTIIDVLRRASVDTVALGLRSTAVQGSHGISIQADALLSEGVDREWDMVVLPGGMPGSANLRDDPTVQDLLKRQAGRGGHVAAICAAPIALARAGLLEGRKVTSYPTFSDKLGEVDYQDTAVVVDGKIVTSRAPGTALAFALKLVALLKDEKLAGSLGQQMLAP